MLYRLLLAFSVLFAPPIAHADWHEASSKHFVVYSDESPDKLKAYTEQLERFDLTLRMITGTPDKPLSPNMRVRVFMVANLGEVHKLADDSGVAGFYIPRASGPIAVVPQGSGGGSLDSQTVLQHEYAHSFMFSTWPSVVFPKWFVEGFAEFVGTAYFRNDGTLIIGKAPEYRAYGIDRTAAMPAQRLLKLVPKDEGLDSQTLYGRGWLLTHYSILGGHADTFAAYLKDLNEGKSIDEANRAFGNLGDLDAKMNAYAKRPSLPSIAVPEGKITIGPIAVRKLSAGEAATMKAQIYSQTGVDEKRAPIVEGWARAAAAPFPNDAGAQNALAEAEFDVKNYAAVEAAADRALAADPGSVHALLYKGMAQMEIAKKAKVTDPARWREIRSWFIKANKLDTEYAQPLVLFYQSFEAAGQAPSKSAQDGLLGAYVRAPFDNNLRVQAGKVLLQQNNVTAARIALEKVAYGPHGGPPENNVALKMIAALDSGGSEAALKIFAEAEAKAKKEEEEGKKKKSG